MSQDKDDEARAKKFLEAYDLQVEEFPKRERHFGKTPDYRILVNGEVVLFCEVKTIGDNIVVPEAPEGTIATIPLGNPLNRISSKIHEAVKQFQSVNPEHRYPNVLVLMSHDKGCKFHSFVETITGNWVARDGEHHRISAKVSEGRIKEDKFKIDLYLWFDADDEKPYWRYTDNEHYMNVCKYFGKDPSTIPNVEA